MFIECNAITPTHLVEMWYLVERAKKIESLYYSFSFLQMNMYGQTKKEKKEVVF